MKTNDRHKSGKFTPQNVGFTPQDAGLTGHDAAVAQELKSRLSECVPLHRIAVFGSRARGDADADADMDVLVETETLTREVRNRVTETAWELSLENNMVIVPVTVDRKEWEEGVQRSSLLALAVEQDGVAI